MRVYTHTHTRVLPAPSSTGMRFSTAATSASRSPERPPATAYAARGKQDRTSSIHTPIDTGWVLFVKSVSVAVLSNPGHSRSLRIAMNASVVMVQICAGVRYSHRLSGLTHLWAQLSCQGLAHLEPWHCRHVAQKEVPASNVNIHVAPCVCVGLVVVVVVGEHMASHAAGRAKGAVSLCVHWPVFFSAGMDSSS